MDQPDPPPRFEQGGRTEPRRRVRRGNTEDARALRKDLLAAAMQLFARGGVDALTMRAVAEAVGVSVMTPYRYFADKSELMRGLWQVVLRAACDRMRAAVDEQASGRAKQRAMMEAFLDHWEEHPDHFRLVYQTDKVTQQVPVSPLTQEPVYAELLQLVQGVTAAVAEEIGAGPEHIKLAGDLRFSMLLGYLQAAMVNRRYPWSDLSVLRRTCVEQAMAVVERVLLQGPPDP